MNSFGDYQSQPPGYSTLRCKDLIDVLNFKHAGTVTPWLSSAAASEGAQTGGFGVAGLLADIGDYVSRFSTSSAKSRSLWIRIRWDATALVAVFCNKHGSPAMVFVDSGREQAVRSVLTDSGVSPTRDDLLHNDVRGLFCQLSSISDLGQFIRELLTKGFSVTPETPLEFNFREKNTAEAA